MKILCKSYIRKSVEDGDLIHILHALKRGYTELVESGIIDRDDYNYHMKDVEYLIDDIEDSQEDVLPPYILEQYVEDVDHQLSEFYDLCDDAGIWINI